MDASPSESTPASATERRALDATPAAPRSSGSPRRAADLRSYARAIVEIGAGLQPGQTLTIRSPLEAVDLVRAVTAAAYERGASLVDVEWRDPALDAVRLEHADPSTLDRTPSWRGQAMEDAAARGDAFVGIVGVDPDLLAPFPAGRVATLRGARREALRGYYAYTMSNAVRWVVAAAATPSWAAKVFPELEPNEAVDVLWDHVLRAARADRDDPVRAWEEHLTTLEAHRTHLQQRGFRALRFRSELGTDLTVGLADGHRWFGGDSRTPDGVRFVANLPTEEVFTAPHKDRVDGVVVASKPLSHAGTLIDGFRFVFRDGRVVDAHAERGQAALDRLLDSDEGARRLGEVALVPNSSPVAQSGLLYYETLFDENAASHLALGRAYAFTADAGAEGDASPEALGAVGLNQSLEHVDFMIGDATTDVVGVRPDGGEEPVMRQGEFVL